MAESSKKRKAVRVPLAARSNNTTHQTVPVEYDDDDNNNNDDDDDDEEEDQTFEAPRTRKISSQWAWKKRTLAQGHIATTDQRDEAQLEPTNVQEAWESELELDDDQIGDADSDILEALHNTSRTWLQVRLGDVTATPARDEQYSINIARCEENVRHVLESRFKSTLQYKDPDHSAMTATTTAMIRKYGVEVMFKTFKECCPLRTQEIIGREPLTEADLLEIQPPTLEQLSYYADYLSLCLPTQMSPSSEIGATDIGLYVGSASGMYGLNRRWIDYDTWKAKAMDGVRTSSMKGTHPTFALQLDYTMHLRAWMFFPPQRFSKQQCLLWEGFGMDLFNTLHLEDEETNRYRTTEVLLEAAKAVPPRRAKPLWKGLNDAHALKQGVGPPNEYCYMQSKGCLTEVPSAVAQPGLLDLLGEKVIYLCIPCTLQFYEYRTVWSCNEDGRRCSRPRHKHKVLSTAKREDCFEAWTLDAVRRWTEQDQVNSSRLALFVKQNWKCPCGRALRSPDAEIGSPDSFRGTLIPLAPEATLGCDACYTDWYLHQPENATVLQLEAWKTARNTWRASVDAKPQHEACICSTDDQPVVANLKVANYNDLDKACSACSIMAKRIINMWEINMDSVEDNARALRLLIGMRGALNVQLERYLTAPDCPCAGKDERVPALLEWVTKDQFPLEEPKFVCNRCRRSWTLVPTKYKTEARARKMFLHN